MQHFKDTDGRSWEVLSIEFWTFDFGRGCAIIANSSDLEDDKSFVYNYEANELLQWRASEVMDSTPIKPSINTFFPNLFKFYTQE